MQNVDANLAASCGQQSQPPSLIERKAGRFSTIGLNCSVGKIIDLSRDGMRVRARTAPRGVFTVEIRDRNVTIYVAAEVVWSKRVGLFRKDFGLRFIDVPRETVTKLSLIAQARSRQASV